MDEFDLQFSDVVLFELPTFEAAQAFRVRLRPRWPGWSHTDEHGWLFATSFATRRTIWRCFFVRRSSSWLSSICGFAVFVLDGRSYVLEAAELVYEQAA